MEGEDLPGKGDVADDFAIDVLEEDFGDSTTRALKTLDDEDEPEVAVDEDDDIEFTIIEKTESEKITLASVLAEIEKIADEEPPDIGDSTTSEEVKGLRRERHKLLLTVGREASMQVLPTTFKQFQERLLKVDKRSRRVRAWLEAVDRAGSTNNPLARRLDMNVDASKAAKQLKEIERERHLVLRALAEALTLSEHLSFVCAEQRERVKAINARLDQLIPVPEEKKSLLSRFLKE